MRRPGGVVPRERRDEVDALGHRRDRGEGGDVACRLSRLRGCRIDEQVELPSALLRIAPEGDGLRIEAPFTDAPGKALETKTLVAEEAERLVLVDEGLRGDGRRRGRGRRALRR